MDELVLTESNTQKKIDFSFSGDELLINKRAIGSTEEEKINYNVYTVARKNAHVKRLIVELSNTGMTIVSHGNGISKLVRFKDGNSFIQHMRGYEYTNLTAQGRIICSLEMPTKMPAKRMLVVFSSVADNPYATNLAKRNFFKNFPNIGKYIPPDTCILRLSDIGSVVGSFYLNNNYDSDVEENVQKAITHTSASLDIDKENVVLYGVSKGGTGSLFHGTTGNYKSVAVDPIVSDEHHENAHNDSHFTIGTFPHRKFEKFTKLFETSQPNSTCCIITSSGSPIFKYIQNLSRNVALDKKVSIYNYQHKNIKDHPDVGGNSINLLTTLINGHFYNLLNGQSKTLPHGK